MILICIDNEGAESNLTMDKRYIVIEIMTLNDKECLIVSDDNNAHFVCMSNRFMNLSDYRNEKINRVI